MARSRSPRYGFLVLAPLIALSSGTAAANPVPSQITYNTVWPGPIKGLADAPVFEFQGVENGTATVGSLLKLGTVLIHQTSPPGGYTLDGDLVPVEFKITSVDGKPVAWNAPIVDEGHIYGTVYPDGTVGAGLFFFGTYNPLNDPSTGYLDSFQAGGLTLKLRSPSSEDGPLWNLSSNTPVVAVDIYAELLSVPEPGA